MRGNVRGRLERLEGRVGSEADSGIDLSGPIDERHLAFLDEYERITGNTTVAERQDPACGRELTRLAAEAALRPFGFSDEDIAAYLADLDAGHRELEGRDRGLDR